MSAFTDDLNRVIKVPQKPRKVVSLVPSITESIIDLGWMDKLAGRTAYCIHPGEFVKEVPVVGGTKNISKKEAQVLQPDLIFAAREENDKNQVMDLAGQYPVYVFDVKSIDQGLEMISRIAELMGDKNRGLAYAGDIKQKLLPQASSRGSLLYLVWRKPWMGAGRNTFIDSVIRQAGFQNIIQKKGYPKLESLRDFNPDYVLAPNEPYDFSEKELEELKHLFKDSKVLKIDGEIFSWYGTHMRMIPDYITHLL